MDIQQFDQYDDDIRHFAEGEEPDYDDEVEEPEELPEEGPVRIDGKTSLSTKIQRYIDLDKRLQETLHITTRQQVLLESDPNFAKFEVEATTTPHRSLPFLTKYERSALISERAVLLAHPHTKMTLPYVDPSWSLIEIATREVDQKTLPAILRRTLPNGKLEHWKLQDLQPFPYAFGQQTTEYPVQES